MLSKIDTSGNNLPYSGFKGTVSSIWVWDIPNGVVWVVRFFCVLFNTVIRWRRNG